MNRSTASSAAASLSPRLRSLPAPPSRSVVLIGGSVGILLLTILAYLPAMRGPFIMDDDLLVTENPMVKSADGLRRFWLTTEAPDYFPLTSTSFWIEWRMWGMNPTGYRATNVVLHALSAILIWRILNRLDVPGAWVAAAAFALHPVCVASVAWIAERKNTLPMVFYLLSILLYLDFDARPREARWKYAASLGAFVLAMLAKTSVVMLPVVLLLCAWWRHRRVRRADLLRSIPFFILSAALSAVTVWFQYTRAIGEDVVRTDSPLSRTVVAGCAIWFYLLKTIAPVGLSMIYPRWDLGGVSWTSALPGMALVILFAICWRYRATWGRSPLLALGYFVVSLFPVLGFFNIYFMKFALVADHYAYIALIGVIALAVGAAAHALRRAPRAGVAFVVATLVVLVVLLALTSARARLFADEQTLWADAAAKASSSWVVQNNYAHALLRHYKTDIAAEHFRESLRLDPDNQEAKVELDWPRTEARAPASSSAEREREREAVRLLYAYADAHEALGEWLSASGRTREALDHLYKVLILNPDHVAAHLAVAHILESQGRADDALVHYDRAVHADPDSVPLRLRLANALLARGILDDARRQFERVLGKDPNNAAARHGLAIALAKTGHADQAEEMLRQVVADAPDFAEAHNNLGLLLAQRGDVDGAIAEYRRALEIKPDFAAARRNLDGLVRKAQ